MEAVLRELNEQGRAGRTIRNTVDTITTFCNWCVVRGYLLESPLAGELVKRLTEYADREVVVWLYQRFFPRFPLAERALPYVPSHPARELDKDLVAARIPKETKEGKLDFAALRNSYVTLAVEAGANVKELQVLARHRTPDLSLNVYVKARNTRLSELVEKIGENVFSQQECALCVHHSDSDLEEIVRTWPELPEHIKAAIKALVQTYNAEGK